MLDLGDSGRGEVAAQSSPVNGFMGLKGLPVFDRLIKLLLFSLLLNELLLPASLERWGTSAPIQGLDTGCCSTDQTPALLSLTRKIEHIVNSRATRFFF